MLSFEAISKSLADREVLKGVSFRVEKGSVHTILGPTGSGKTVTLRHIVRLLDPDAGAIKYEGRDISSLRGKELEKYRVNFGYLFQSGALIAWLSLEENVALPLVEKTRLKSSDIRKKVSETLELVGLTGSEDKMPDELSGGMKKRAGLARALINNPKVLLLDEPTSGLDPIMSRKIDQIVRDLKDKLGVTIVMVTHDLISAFSISDRITLLLNGMVKFDGSVRDFCASKDEFVQEFIKSQTPRNYVDDVIV